MSQDANVPPPPPPEPPPAAPPTPPPAAGSPPPASGGSGNRTIMLILSYLGLLALIPLLLEKDDQEVQWHAKHGLVLMLASVALGIGLGILFSVISWLDFGCSGCFLMPLFSLAVLGVHIFAIVKALGGDKLRLPIVTDLVDKF